MRSLYIEMLTVKPDIPDNTSAGSKVHNGDGEIMPLEEK